MTTLPVWLLLAALLSPLAEGRLRPLRLLWIALLHMVLESVILVVLLGLVDRVGVRAADPPTVLRAASTTTSPRATSSIFFREASRVLHLEIVTEGPTPDALPGAAARRLLPARRARVTRSR